MTLVYAIEPVCELPAEEVSQVFKVRAAQRGLAAISPGVESVVGRSAMAISGSRAGDQEQRVMPVILVEASTAQAAFIRGINGVSNIREVPKPQQEAARAQIRQQGVAPAANKV